MPLQHARPWGLVAPGRPATPSEGHAQSYARVGPEDSQRLIAFENGTCLRFGPEDLVDEFAAEHPFVNQVAQLDSVIRDLQSVTTRYQGSAEDDDNHVYNDFRTNQPHDSSQLARVRLGSGVYLQVPSRLATVGTLVSVYATPNKSDVCGTAHPGLSVDTRFGVQGRAAGNGESDNREKDESARGERAQQGNRFRGRVGQQNGTQADGHRRHQTRRGRRGPKQGQWSQQRQDEHANYQGGARMQNSRQISNVQYQNSQQGIGNRNDYELQSGSVHATKDHYSHRSSQQITPQTPLQQHMIGPSTSNHELLTEGSLNAMPRSQVQQLLQPQPNPSQLQGGAQLSQEFSLERYGEESSARNIDHVANLDTRSELSDDFKSQASPRYNDDEETGDRELALFADEMNRQRAHPVVGGLRGNGFVVRLQPASPTPNALVVQAERRLLQQRFSQNNQQSIGSYPNASSSQHLNLLQYLEYHPNRKHTTISGGGMSDGSTYYDQSIGSDRSRPADKRGANVGVGISTENALQSRCMNQGDSTLLAPSRVSRSPSPIGHPFSSQSSPGAPGLLRGQGRSASTGRICTTTEDTEEWMHEG